jgi:hypothetical protein
VKKVKGEEGKRRKGNTACPPFDIQHSIFLVQYSRNKAFSPTLQLPNSPFPLFRYGSWTPVADPPVNWGEKPGGRGGFAEVMEEMEKQDVGGHRS